MRQRKLVFATTGRRSPGKIKKLHVVIGFAAILVLVQLGALFLARRGESALIEAVEASPGKEETPRAFKRVSLNSSASRDLKPSSSLPAWIRNYLDWHQSMRARYPGKELFGESNGSPKLLIRTCLGLCGGLHDRLGQLPMDLYLANQTNRLLLLHWHRPVALEEFLVPNELDWSIPKEIRGFFARGGRDRVSREDMKLVRAYDELFEGYSSENPTNVFWESHMDEALRRATTGAFKDKKVLRHRILGHLGEGYLEERLRRLGETDMLHWTPSFGSIFWMFFRPSSAVQTELDTIYKSLSLAPSSYSAVHCRVRHPKAHPPSINVKGKNADYPADKTGLPWTGRTRAMAIETATGAIRCARTRLHEHEPLYFFSDSNDLVRFMAHELTDGRFVAANASLFISGGVDARALAAVQSTKIVARTVVAENPHIDRQKGRPAAAYYPTFVDLLLAVRARCITYGVGFYAVFAAKISGTPCKTLYMEETWGGSYNKSSTAEVCKA